MATKKANQWWLIFTLSLLITVLSVFIMLKPASAFVGLALFFAWSMMFSGVFNFIFAIRNVKTLDSWWWFLILGLLEIVISVALFIQPQISGLALILYVGFWLTFRAIMSISYSFELKKIGFKDWWLNLIGGIITLIFTFMMIANPVFGAISVVYLTGISLLLSGLFGMYLSFKLKKIESFLQIV